jgi:archaeal flagellar protein FlaJ
MGIFDKKKQKRVIEVGGQKIELEPKPGGGPLLFFAPKKAKPTEKIPAAKIAGPSVGLPRRESQFTTQTSQNQVSQNKIDADKGVAQAQAQPKASRPKLDFGSMMSQKPKASKIQELHLDVKPMKTEKLEFSQGMMSDVNVAAAQELGAPAVMSKKQAKPNIITNYLRKTSAKQKGLANALREEGMKTEVYDFVRRMFIASVILSIVLTITIFILFTVIGLSTIECVILALVMGAAIFQTAFRTFLQYPFSKSKSTSKNVERDILFAARDLIISLRSGMPLFNAITSVSQGYGDASKEFAKIVDRVQLGMPLEEAIDDTIATTKSPSFRRIMLQASVSIKAGADVVGALQSIIDQLSQERIIELRSYGQKLNAIAMFYMLFGVILPSMGIAVITILTTFIALFTVDTTVFEFVLIGILALQIIFLKLITASRPVFTM